jgi:1,4-alpha-glucan branching enzyme
MPFNEFEGNSSWGYNSSFYFAPDKYYGTKNSLKAFIDLAHQKGIAVIMDLVLNHTYGPSPLARLYWDEVNQRPASNNPWYNPVAPHSFLNFGNDFNHESAATKAFFNRVLQHWITEYKIDGYRLDFTKGLTQKASNDDNSFSAYDASRIAIINSYANAIKAIQPDTYIILEHFAADNEEIELANAGYLLWASVWTQYQEAAMGWLSNSNLSRGIHSTRGFNSPHLVTFMESHDEERVTHKVIKYGNTNGAQNVRDTIQALKRMELSSAFLFTIPGPKMIWQFGELGYDFSRCYLSTNGDGGNCDKKLDPKPIRWDYLNEARRKQVYNTYSNLIKLRSHTWYKDLFLSGIINQDVTGGFKWLRVNSGDTSRLMVVGNFDVNTITGTVTFPSAGTWYDYLGNTTFAATGSAQTITLQPGQFHVYLNRNVNQSTTTPVINIPSSGAELEAKIFPNPVVSDYTIEMYVPEAGPTRMELLNINGQSVATVFEKFLPKGKQQITLSRNAIGAAAGTYFITIHSKGAQKTIKLTLQ